MSKDGLCKCGCGNVTSIVKYDNDPSGKIKGEHRDFCAHHYYSHMRNINPGSGKQYARTKKCEEIRLRVVDAMKKAPRNFCVQTLASIFKTEGFSACGISRIFTVANYFGELKPLLKKPKISPPYERKLIPDEFSTEIRLLVNKARAFCLDADYFDSGEPNGSHSRSFSETKTPLDYLMEKEEREENDRYEKFFRNRHRECFVKSNIR